MAVPCGVKRFSPERARKRPTRECVRLSKCEISAREPRIAQNNSLAAGILIQVNRSNGGLPKRGVAGPVMLTEISIEGDRCRNRRVHGGPQQAVLMLAAEVIDGLAAQGYPVFYGALGENLTVSGLD